MNMFRMLITLALVALSISLWVGKPEEWIWIKIGGPYAITALNFLVETRPFSCVILFFVAVALFITRKQY